MPEPQHRGEKSFRGIPVSAGVCRGKILVLGRARPAITKLQLSDDALAEEVNRLEKALVQTRHQILEIQRKVSEGMGAQEGSIFDAHLLVLEDRTLLDEIMRVIQEQKVNAEHAFHTVADRYAATLSTIEDDYLRERATDMRDVTTRVLNNLLGLDEGADLRHLKEPCIIISHDLTPSKTAQLDKRNVLGFATDVGSKTSHTAIMARSLRIPAVVGLKDVSGQLESGQYALLDGLNGVLIVNPTDQTLYEYGQLILRQATLQQRLRDLLPEPAVTLDGHRVMLSANIEQAADAEQVKANGAEGVGLFRTEYLFLNRERLPGEEQQYESYREAAAALKPLPVVIRTLDLGGDKFLAHMQMPTELNPFLGWRAIRISLQERDIFRAQLRAILRASAEGNIKMMYPMISGLEELKQANALLEEYKAELRQEKIPFDENLEVGAMIETPSAAIVADSLAKHVKLLQHRDKRFDPVLAGGGPHEREDRPSLRANPSGHRAADQKHRGGGSPAQCPGDRLRRDGWGPGAGAVAAGAGGGRTKRRADAGAAAEVSYPPTEVERGSGVGSFCPEVRIGGGHIRPLPGTHLGHRAEPF